MFVRSLALSHPGDHHLLFLYMDLHLKARQGRHLGLICVIMALEFGSFHGGPPLSPWAGSLSLQILLGQKETSRALRSNLTLSGIPPHQT